MHRIRRIMNKPTVKRKSKRMANLHEKLDISKVYEPEEALQHIVTNASVKFDETLELSVKLGVDSRKAEQQVRGTVVLPHGTGKTVRVLVFTQGEKEQEAKDAGADFVGADDLATKILGGWTDFDAVVASPDMMRVVGKLGKVLGPRGLMPSPKSGTVTPEVGKAVAELKMGKISFRVNKFNDINIGFGKISQGYEKLNDNLKTLLNSIVKAKPPTSKGTYLKSITFSSTMGVGLRVNNASARKFAEEKS